MDTQETIWRAGQLLREIRAAQAELLLEAIHAELEQAPERTVYQHDGTLIFETRRRGDGGYRGMRSLRFNPQNGYWEEYGERVHYLARADRAFLAEAAPWTVARYADAV